MALELREIVDSLHELSHGQVEKLFFHLGVDLSVIEDIERYKDRGMFRIYIVRAWLDCDVDSSWEKIVKGLRQMRLNALANWIAKKHGLPAHVVSTSSEPAISLSLSATRLDVTDGMSSCSHSGYKLPSASAGPIYSSFTDIGGHSTMPQHSSSGPSLFPIPPSRQLDEKTRTKSLGSYYTPLSCESLTSDPTASACRISNARSSVSDELVFYSSQDYHPTHVHMQTTTRKLYSSLSQQSYLPWLPPAPPPDSHQASHDHHMTAHPVADAIIKAHRAASIGDLQTLHHMLASHEVDTLCMDDTGLTLAHTAAMTNNLTIIIMLVNEGGLLLRDLQLQDDHSFTPAMLAVRNECVEVLQWLLEEGMVPLLVKDACGETLIHHAAHYGSVNCLQWLLKYYYVKPGGKDECLDDLGTTPAHFAAQKGHLECVQMMIDHNHSVVTPDKEGQKPIDWAHVKGQTVCVRYLLMHEKCLQCCADVEHLSKKLKSKRNKIQKLESENAALKEKLSKKSSKRK